MMTTSFISSLSLWNASRDGVPRLQAGLANATREIAELRHADIGLALGARVGESLVLRQRTAELEALRDGNGVAASRLTASQAALKQIQSAADALQTTLIGLSDGQRAGAAAGTAASQLAALTAALNTSVSGQYVFGGTRADAPPVAAYAGSPASPARAAVEAAFRDHFGFAKDSPRAAGVTASDMKAFLATRLEPLASESSWTSLWSQASSRNIDSRISLSETIETSANANAPALRKLAMAYVIASDLNLAAMPVEAQAVATARVMTLLGEASAGLVAMQADLGRAQSRITDASSRIASQTTLLAAEINRLEAVDPAEARSRVDAVTTQLQMSYALTAQLRQLSLVAFIA
ncbi:flagellar hook-associated family protein [Methylobacterium segetis]|uniref:flagellar hook-associated family protein n=1 Tax=Methylobacterium segetis TaxID=2488750 RepID=UPI00104D37BE|nr:flagellar hook-associated family protein [Methylobacterium segetis]